ncbi:hypothetical protein STRAU_2490 [Streptomyces aurantiacus JA 4570]|uniref:Uncharacterized protein n=1 Tax=Streptomyces aurantiacus JA 4570 TaxID=1286094 RepID=S4A163_9ACTN|nr:hypothetical protein STRAU_2490 [Streptomyces aurantiacus JA 4570]
MQFVEGGAEVFGGGVGDEVLRDRGAARWLRAGFSGVRRGRRRPAADPAAFGMPTGDDGRRDDPLLSDRSWAVSSYRPEVDALPAAPTRVVIAVGEESEDVFTGRTAVATARLLGRQAVVFPGHHGGFLDGEFGYAGRPAAFALRLCEVLDGAGDVSVD